jgi:hypothetical protein
MLTTGDIETSGTVASKEGVVLGFKELSNAAYDPKAREAMQGKNGLIAGMYSPRGSDKQFTLFRLNMNCCQADAVPVEVFIVSEENITRIKPQQWVEVEGKIEFHKIRGRGEKYVPVLRLDSADRVKPTTPRVGLEI